MDGATANNWSKALRGEPRLGDVMADPTVGALMASDRVSRAELDRLVANYRAHKRARSAARRAA